MRAIFKIVHPVYPFTVYSFRGRGFRAFWLAGLSVFCAFVSMSGFGGFKGTVLDNTCISLNYNLKEEDFTHLANW